MLRGLVAGELRQGALAGVMADAVAAAAGVPRRGRAPRADAARRPRRGRRGGAAPRASRRCAASALEVGRPLQPMLASPPASLGEALGRLGDGAPSSGSSTARAIQVHRDGDDVARLHAQPRRRDRAAARGRRRRRGRCRSARAVLDGEAIALRADGRPEPFQVTGSRSARVDVGLRRGAADAVLLRRAAPRRRRPARRAAGRTRRGARRRRRPSAARAARRHRRRRGGAGRLLRGALARGHEGVMVKSLDAPYAAGPARRRVAEGQAAPHARPRRAGGRVGQRPPARAGCRNLHLGARAAGGGGFVMLGKTFKGLTDELLAWQTARLLALAASSEGHVVHVRPELVVEIAFDGVQTSPRYPGGVALRFARVKGYRETSGRTRRTRSRPCGRSSRAARRADRAGRVRACGCGRAALQSARRAACLPGVATGPGVDPALRMARRRRIDGATRGVPRARTRPCGAGAVTVEHPRTLAEALALRARYPDAMPLAGGTDLMVGVNAGRRRPTSVVALDRLAELRDVAPRRRRAAARRRRHLHAS